MKLFNAGFLLALSLCLDIGIVNVAMIRAGIERGFFPALKLGLGSTAGDLIYAILSVMGIGMLLTHSWFRWTIWIGGTFILLFFCVNIIVKLLKHNFKSGDEITLKSKWDGKGNFIIKDYCWRSHPRLLLSGIQRWEAA